MAEHLSEEEQLENLKKWWRNYGVVAITVVSISVGSYFGLNFYKENERIRSEESSSKYQDMMDICIISSDKKISATQLKLIQKLASELKSSDDGSQYSIYSALLMAKLHVEKNNLDLAAEELNWALSRSQDDLAPIIKLRLARVEASRGNIDLALSMINQNPPKVMTSAYHEAKGDFYLLKEDKVTAYDHYSLALSQLQDHDMPHLRNLKLKLNKVSPIPSTQDMNNKSGDEN